MKTRRGMPFVAIAGLSLSSISLIASPANAEHVDPQTRGRDGGDPQTRGRDGGDPQTPRHATGPDTWPAEVRAIFVGVSGGIGFANVKLPALGTPRMYGPMLAFQLGYRVSPRVRVSLVYTDFQQSVSRLTAAEQFQSSTAFIRRAADCNTCRPPLPGGDIGAATLRISSLGPAVDVTPFGPDGLFLGASGGVAMAGMTETSYGVAGTARLGFRLRPVENLSIALEGGAQGQYYSGGSAALGYGAAEARLSF